MLFIVLVTFFVYFQPTKQEANKPEVLTQTVDVATDKQLIADTIEKPVAPLSLVSNDTETVEFTGLQINESNEYLELTLKLPSGAQSFLKESSLNRYVFLISNTSKKIIIPEIKDNIWLDRIVFKETSAGQEIQFYTMDKVLVETRYSEQQQGNYWLIRLKHSKPEKIVKQTNRLVDMAKKTTLLEPVKQLPKSLKQKPDSAQGKNNTHDYIVPEKTVRLSIKPVTVKETHEELLRKAQLDIQQQDWTGAKLKLTGLLGSKLDKKARVILLTLLKQQKKLGELKILLSKSIELYPGDADFFAMDADLLFTEKNFLTLLERYKNNVKNKNIINFVAASFQSISQYDNAINYYQISLKIDPQQPRQWISLGISQEHVSQYERARQAYRMALNSGSLNNSLQSFIQNRLQQLSDSAD